MLFVLAILMLVLIVVIFLLILCLIRLGQLGVVVLLYHCTHYPTRGGHSERGIAAGMFALNFNIIDSAIGWGSATAPS